MGWLKQKSQQKIVAVVCVKENMKKRTKAVEKSGDMSDGLGVCL